MEGFRDGIPAPIGTITLTGDTAYDIEIYKPNEVIDCFNKEYARTYGDWMDININEGEGFSDGVISRLRQEYKRNKNSDIFVLIIKFYKDQFYSKLIPGVINIISDDDFGFNFEFTPFETYDFYIKGKLELFNDEPAKSIDNYLPGVVAIYDNIELSQKIGVPAAYIESQSDKQKKEDKLRRQERANVLGAMVIYHELNEAEKNLRFAEVFSFEY